MAQHILYRIKTLEEMLKEFGEDWRNSIVPAFNSDGLMDDLLGKMLSPEEAAFYSKWNIFMYDNSRGGYCRIGSKAITLAIDKIIYESCITPCPYTVHKNPDVCSFHCMGYCLLLHQTNVQDSISCSKHCHVLRKVQS